MVLSIAQFGDVRAVYSLVSSQKLLHSLQNLIHEESVAVLLRMIIGHGRLLLLTINFQMHPRSILVLRTRPHFCEIERRDLNGGVKEKKECSFLFSLFLKNPKSLYLSFCPLSTLILVYPFLSSTFITLFPPSFYISQFTFLHIDSHI